MTDKEKIKEEIERLHELLLVMDGDNVSINYTETICTALEKYIDSLPEEPASEDKSEKELAETYLAVFDKKHPILPTLKGKQKADFKNFLNKCQQEFGLKEFGIHPTQSKLFEKLTLLWATWGAEHLEGLGKSNQDELDKEYASKDLEEEINRIDDWCPVDLKYIKEIAHHFVEWQKKRDFPAKDITDSAMYWCGYKDCKEEMMKDAVELHIIESFNPVGIKNEKPHGFTALCDNTEYPNFYQVVGQTIKVIPIKTEQQNEM